MRWRLSHHSKQRLFERRGIILTDEETRAIEQTLEFEVGDRTDGIGHFELKLSTQLYAFHLVCNIKNQVIVTAKVSDGDRPYDSYSRRHKKRDFKANENAWGRDTREARKRKRRDGSRSNKSLREIA